MAKIFEVAEDNTLQEVTGPNVRKIIAFTVSNAEHDTLTQHANRRSIGLSQLVYEAVIGKTRIPRPVKVAPVEKYGSVKCPKDGKIYNVATDYGQGMTRKAVAEKHEVSPEVVTQYSYTCGVKRGSLL